MTCKDCLYYEHCHSQIAYGMGSDDLTGEYFTDIESRCKSFKNKADDESDGLNLYEVMLSVLDLIKCKDEQIEALIAGQETLQKALAKNNAKLEALQMDNAQLQSDNINANQNLDHITCLYEAEKESVKKVKEKCIYFAKEVQTAKAEIERFEECASREMLYEKVKSEAIKEFAEKVKQKTLAMVFSPDVLSFEDYCECIDNLVKEMVDDKK